SALPGASGNRSCVAAVMASSVVAAAPAMNRCERVIDRDDTASGGGRGQARAFRSERRVTRVPRHAAEIVGLSSPAWLEAIADVTNGPNIDRAMRIGLHFAPERRDTPIDTPSGDEHGIPPDGIQDRVA